MRCAADPRALRTPLAENARVSRLVYTGKTIPVYSVHVMQYINILHYEITSTRDDLDLSTRITGVSMD